MSFSAATRLLEPTRQIVTSSGMCVSLSLSQDVELTDKDNYVGTFSFSTLSPFPRLHAPIFNQVCDLISTHSLSYAHLTFWSWRRMLEAIGPFQGDLSLQALDVFQRPVDPPAISYRSFIQASLHRWIESGRPGLDASLIDFLEGPEQWEEKGNGAYFALVANDPMRGALTQQELDNVADETNAALVSGRITKDDHLLIWCFLSLGLRPIQLHRMWPRHVLKTSGPEGVEITLLIPLAKGEGQVEQGVWRRRAPTVLVDCLSPYMDRTDFAAHPDGRLFRFSTAKELSRHFQNLFISSIRTVSDRLDGDPIPMFPYRLRYTLGTRAIADGASDHEVARLLTHRKITSIGSYRASLPMLQRPIKEAIGKEHSYFAKAFKGRLIADLQQSKTNGNDDQIIRDFLRLAGAVVGGCGNSESCYLNAPIACLTCPFFEPLIGAPWQKLLEHLLEDRERELEPKIQQINDKAICAIKEIMQLSGASK